MFFGQNVSKAHRHIRANMHIIYSTRDPQGVHYQTEVEHWKFLKIFKGVLRLQREESRKKNDSKYDSLKIITKQLLGTTPFAVASY